MVRTSREVAPLERVQALQSHLASSTDLNSITELIKQIEELHTQLEEVDDQRSHIKALTLATRVVSRALVTLSDKGTFDTDLTDADGRLVLQEASDAKAKVSRWLRQQWNTSVSLILDELLYSGFAPVRQAALEVCMALQTASSEALHKHGTIKSGRWSVTPFRPLVQTVLWRQVPDDVLETLAEEYLEVYDDVRFFFCKEVSRVLRNVPDASIKNERVRSHARALLSRITAIPTEPSHLNNFLIPHLSHAPKRKSRIRSLNLPYHRMVMTMTVSSRLNPLSRNRTRKKRMKTPHRASGADHAMVMWQMLYIRSALSAKYLLPHGSVYCSHRHMLTLMDNVSFMVANYQQPRHTIFLCVCMLKFFRTCPTPVCCMTSWSTVSIQRELRPFSPLMVYLH